MNKPLHRLLWRLHFWAGLIGAPIVLFAALTGLLYVFTPQIEAWRHAELDRVVPADRLVPLDAQVIAALAAAPDRTLRHVVPAWRPGDSTQVYVSGPHEHHAGNGHDHGLPQGAIVYVNPHSGAVLGVLPEMQRIKTWAKRLHSSALQGNGWRWLLELGASWMLVLFASGLVLWWPKGSMRAALRPSIGRGRRSWREWHVLAALLTSAVLLIVLVTGLTWSLHAGERFKQMQQALDQQAPRVPKDLKSRGEGPGLDWQAAWERARAAHPGVSLQISAPKGPEGVWRAENFDRSQPTERFQMALDARDGAVLFDSGWAQLPALSRATAVGIPFHRGEFGLWNQTLLALTALACLFSVLSGLAMWWQRRPSGRLAAPPLTRADLRLQPWRWLLPLAAAWAYALPVWGWSVLVLLAVEGLRLAWRQPGAGAAPAH